MKLVRIGWLAGIITLCLVLGWPMESRAAKYTEATSNGNWADAIWNNGAPAEGDDVVIASGVSVTVTVSVVSLNSFTNNGTLTFIGWETVLTSTVVQVNGTITHPPQSATTTNESGAWVPDNRVFIVCSNLTVASGGKIDASHAGYTGNTYAPGYGPGGGVGAVGWWAGGGSYGGIGFPGGSGGPYLASSNYGLLTAPEDPGSAGGGAYGGSPGGNGGGAVKIAATGYVTVDGTLAANGQKNGSGAGGGSGGSIFIACQALQGTGVVSVAGGAGVGYAGGGGGGRLAIIGAGAAQDAMPRQTRLVTAAGGTGSGMGGFGTLYVSRGSFLLDPNSVLTVTNNMFDLRFPADFYCDGTLLVTNGGRVVILAAPTNGATAYGSLASFAQGLIVAADSSLILSSAPTNGGSVKIVVRDLFVANGGVVSASSNGYCSDYGPGRGSLGTGGHGSSGGSYGGTGGMGSGGDYGYGVYGSSNAPADPGSPGGFWVPTSIPGGSGGGLIWVQAGRTIRIDGQMTADGGNCGGLEGAGSGGGIYLTCKSLAGIGLIRAKGGTAISGGFSGGGGGGRIAVQYQNTNDWSGTLSYAAGSVDGGTGGSGNGTVGTVVWGQLRAPGTVIIIR